MNLPNDVARCAGVLEWGDYNGNSLPEKFCPYASRCERYLQVSRDIEAGLANYHGIPVMMHCLVDGEYTMMLGTKDAGK